MSERIVILGRGVSGQAAALLAEKIGASHTFVCDGDAGAAQAIAEADVIVVSPGFRAGSAVLALAERSGKPVIGELEFGFRHFAGKVAAVTGTDGKTTTTEWTTALLRAGGLDAREAGNIGRGLAEVAASEHTAETVAVVEVSSFQLERVERFAPVAAALLNIGCDHLDRYHGSMEEYAAVKRRIFDRVPPENRVFGRTMPDRPARQRIAEAGGVLSLDGRPILKLAETAIRGEHNLENLQAALELASRFLPDEFFFSAAFRTAAAGLAAGRHRIETVRVLNGVRYVNDSKATNPHAAEAALATLAPDTARFQLLLGGLDKGMDFRPLAAWREKIGGAFLYGACREAIRKALEPAIPCRDFGTDFEAAFAAAAAAAKAGDTVLLAPACASMDMFKNYQERGDRFRALVEALPEKRRAPRNRTLTLTPDEAARFRAQLARPEAVSTGWIDRVFCGDMMDVLDRLPAGIADLLILDPPYNLDRDFNGRKFRRISDDAYRAYLESWFPRAIRLLKPAGSCYLCGDWRCSAAQYEVMSRYCTIRSRIVWQREKGRAAARNWKNCTEDIWFGTLSDDYTFHADAVRQKRQVIAPYRDETGPRGWEEGREGRFRLTAAGNFWDDLSVPYWSMPENTDHPTQKPEKLFAKLILASTDPGGLVLDPFLGSGTAAVTAAKLGRHYCGIEIDEEYACWALKRLAAAADDPRIQGFEDGVFWERNSRPKKRK